MNGPYFEGDALNCFDGTPDEKKNLELAENYWLNGPNDENHAPITELLVGGEIVITEIVKEFNANLG